MRTRTASRYVSVACYAAAAGLSKGTVRRLCREGKVIGTRRWPNGHWRVYRSEFERVKGQTP